MRQTWRWFGPTDAVRIEEIVQTGAQGIVSALHHVPDGEVWAPGAIAERQQQIRLGVGGLPSGLEWEVVESLPVSEDIKRQTGDWREHIANYKISLENLARAGITTICYNFMPVLDWTRTHLRWRLPNGATCMRFDAIDFAVFDLFILERAEAGNAYGGIILDQARRRFAEMPEDARQALVASVLAGLPGAADRLSLSSVRDHLAVYADISEERLRGHLFAFLEEVAPVAAGLGMRLACHPDDPPFAIMGLPRIMSTEADFRRTLAAVDSPANGMTLCSGSLGARSDNDLPGMMRRLGSRVHFLHLRNVRREAEPVGSSFYESEHFDGSVDMVALVDAVLAEEHRRRVAGRPDNQIPMRPDHGQEILEDLTRGAQPGYPLIGRLKGLAELRGAMLSLERAYAREPLAAVAR